MIGIIPKYDGVERKAKTFKREAFVNSSRDLRRGRLYN
jgi:hypothetical protein